MIELLEFHVLDAAEQQAHDVIPMAGLVNL